MTTTFPRYFKYPGDGYNNWKVVVLVDDKGTVRGTTKVYPNGFLLDSITTALGEEETVYFEPLTLAEAVELTR